MDESAQTLAACEGKLKDVVEEKQKLAQTNASGSKELAAVNQHIQEGFM